MKIAIAISTIGTIVLILGIIFHLQGQSIVGPPSSFMYANPDWISYGTQIAIVGTIILAIGIAIKFLKN
ncbi:MAG: hypothetical protein H2B00_05090 [Nitrosopumilaceae archaeon]|uniref:Uncharacterized protein n=2 Tax=Candidatus Nitrosomaritimum aestuariumsis TaxID=3342354 RepID=A0AC60VY67_9ARCH|nr:hypothetical protein [Nitrosopumilaceae archaeon]MBA4460633.1 hypothetical protein [Nitrosopumilaceae archaeon]MBA4461868.1 hypothetical protein [Nitrosopumilaceae archaeon]MBA4463215.1 hypothetical protein [Nitrosopumilaceae archaeon]